MKILSLTICNYKNYSGKQRIEFSTGSSKKRITLIGGQNGAGKSTLFEAIKLCMFGYQFEGKPISAILYQEYIRSCQNNIAKRDNDNDYFIEMEVILDDVQPIYTVTLQRIWHITPVSFKEEFNILRDGHSFEIVEKENWQQYIYDLFPPYTIEYFFFDGEKMKDLIIGDRAEDILRESARDLIGLKIYDTLLSDIGILKDKIKKSTKKDEESQEEYKKLSEKIRDYQSQINSISNKRTYLQQRIIKSNKKIDEIQIEIGRKAGSFAKLQDDLKKSIKDIQTRLNDLNLEISRTCDYVPFIMAAPLMKKAIQQLKHERAFRESSNNKDIVEEIRVSLFEKLDSEKLDDNKKIRADINQILDEYNARFNYNTTNIIHDVNNSTITKLEEYYNEIQKEHKSKFLKLLQERESKDIQLQKLINKEKKIPESVYVESELKDIDDLKKVVSESEREIGKIDEILFNLNQKHDDCLVRLDEIDSASLKIIEDKNKYIACEKIESVLDDFIKYTLITKTKCLEEIIFSMYSQLENKDDFVADIKLNPSTFELTLIGYDGNIINKGALSSGEKEIYALSILWGLSKLSKNHLPIVVDSLLGRLDHSHVSKVVEYFLPNAGDQVLVLSHNREVNKEMYALLKPSISKEYLLSYDQKNKIKKGYFKECI